MKDLVDLVSTKTELFRCGIRDVIDLNSRMRKMVSCQLLIDLIEHHSLARHMHHVQNKLDNSHWPWLKHPLLPNSLIKHQWLLMEDGQLVFHNFQRMNFSDIRWLKLYQ